MSKDVGFRLPEKKKKGSALASTLESYCGVVIGAYRLHLEAESCRLSVCPIGEVSCRRKQVLPHTNFYFFIFFYSDKGCNFPCCLCLLPFSFFSSLSPSSSSFTHLHSSIDPTSFPHSGPSGFKEGDRGSKKRLHRSCDLQHNGR